MSRVGARTRKAEVGVIEGADVLPGPLFVTEARGDHTRWRQGFVRLRHLDRSASPGADAPLKFKDLPSAAIHERPIVERGGLHREAR